MHRHTHQRAAQQYSGPIQPIQGRYSGANTVPYSGANTGPVQWGQYSGASTGPVQWASTVGPIQCHTVGQYSGANNNYT